MDADPGIRLGIKGKELNTYPNLRYPVCIIFISYYILVECGYYLTVSTNENNLFELLPYYGIELPRTRTKIEPKPSIVYT
jgi:hypothetical protein